MTDVCVVLCTVPEDRARPLVDALLHERLIACANFVGPVVSRYVWEGAVEEARETLLVLKAAVVRVEVLRQRILDLHPYEVPEILELPVAGGHPPYLRWVLESCASGP
ncbi:MAG: divalent-cation tolerance protein CutA [Planctomycetota bacterium]